MGVCLYCGKSAGFLKSIHKECRNKNEEGKRQIKDLVCLTATGQFNPDELQPAVTTLVKANYIDHNAATDLIIEAWESAVACALEDGILTKEEEGHLCKVSNIFGLSQVDLDVRGAFSTLIKAAVLRDIMEGSIPQRLNIDGRIPFNLQKNETLVWLFPDAEYLQQKTIRKFVGRSHGASIRICKGVYWRVGEFKGHSISHSETLKYVGCLGVTTKQLYFSGPEKSFRVRYDKIVSWEPYSDGIGITRDAANAKPEAFVTKDGWFTYNMIVNLAQLQPG